MRRRERKKEEREGRKERSEEEVRKDSRRRKRRQRTGNCKPSKFASKHRHQAGSGDIQFVISVLSRLGQEDCHEFRPT